jgi:hypothetical protein
MRLGIFCTKELPAGTELTFDYKFERYGYILSLIFRMEAQPCYCGEDICSGFIGGAKSSELAVDECDGEGEDDDEDESVSGDDEDETSHKKKNVGLKNLHQVKLVIKSLMYASADAKKVLVKLNKIIVIYLLIVENGRSIHPSKICVISWSNGP